MLIKNSSIYLLSNILSSIIPFILLPILTRVLSIEEYGQVALFQVMISGFSTIVGLNSVAAVNRFFFDKNTCNEDSSYITASFLIGTASLLMLIIPVLSLTDTLSKEFKIHESFIICGLFVSFFSYVIQLRLSQWQIRNNAYAYGFLQVSNGLFNFIFSIVLVVCLNEGAQGRVNAIMLSFALFCILSIYSLIKDELIVIKYISFSVLRRIFGYSIPLLPHTIGLFFINSMDRFVIGIKLNSSDVGIYMVAIQLSTSIAIVFDAINKACVPWLYEKLSHNDSKLNQKVRKVVFYYLLILMVLAFISYHISPFVSNLIVGAEYHEVSNVIGWIVLGQFINGMYLGVTNFVFYSKQSFKLSMVTIVTGVLNFIFLIYIVDIYGVIGAAVCYALIKLFQFLGTLVLALKYSSAFTRDVIYNNETRT